MNAIILAGGGKADEFARKHGATNKALISIAGKPMFEHVFNALLESSVVKQIVVVGPVSEFGRYAGARVDVIEDTGDMVDNCLVAIRRLPQTERVAVVTSDIPMITTAVIDTYLASLQSREGDFFYPIIVKEVNEQRYPGVKRTYARLREGTYTGGNLQVVEPRVAEAMAGKMKEFVALRKNVLALCSLIGLKFLLKLVLGQLSIPEVESRMSELLGCKCVAVVCPHPEIGTDVDKDSDLELARRILAGA